MTTWLDIRDAWRGTRHVVQVRAKDEFGHGTWSEWSQEAVGTPWTGKRRLWGPGAGGSAWAFPVLYSPPLCADPWELTSEMEPYSSQVTMVIGPGVSCPHVGHGDTRA